MRTSSEPSASAAVSPVTGGARSCCYGIWYTRTTLTITRQSVGPTSDALRVRDIAKTRTRWSRRYQRVRGLVGAQTAYIKAHPERAQSHKGSAYEEDVDPDASEEIYTRPELARRLVAYFKPTGKVLDPCRGKGAFYDAFVESGRCVMSSIGARFARAAIFSIWNQPVDWIMTNSSWGDSYRLIAQHAFDLAQHVVFLAKLDVALGTFGKHNDFRDQWVRLTRNRRG